MGESREFNVYFDPHYQVFRPNWIFIRLTVRFCCGMCSLCLQSPLITAAYVFDLSFIPLTPNDL
jgi:hypothetical protein